VYERFADQGFTILAFPCNQFRIQEPASNFEIMRLIQDPSQQGQTYPPQPYPFFAKVTVNDESVLCQPGVGEGSCNRGVPRCDDPNPENCLPTSTRCCMANNGVYDFLKGELPGDLDWNFVKFLIDRDGQPVRRYISSVAPNAIEDDIAALIEGKKLPLVLANSTHMPSH